MLVRTMLRIYNKDPALDHLAKIVAVPTRPRTI